MNENPMTLERLKEGTWWWTRPDAMAGLKRKIGGSEHFDPGPGTMAERAAFNYELARRHRRDLTRLLTYPMMQMEVLRSLDEKFARTFAEMITRIPWAPGHDNEHGWTPVSKRQWNLRMGDSQLKNAFHDYIQHERQLQRIKPPTGNQTRKNRGLSWRWPELLDRDFYKLGSFEDGEKTALYSAKRRAEELATEFCPLLERLNRYVPGGLALELEEGVQFRLSDLLGRQVEERPQSDLNELLGE